MKDEYEGAVHEPDGCPKCGFDLVYPPCPFSGWLRCASKDCGVCFNEWGEIIIDEDYQKKVKPKTSIGDSGAL